MDHADLAFVSSECTYTFQASTDVPGSPKKNFTVAWTSSDLGQYEVTVSSPGGTVIDGELVPYSLYSLCVQNRRCAVRLSNVSGSNVVIWKSDLVTKQPANKGAYRIPMTDILSNPNPKPNPENVRFVSFASDQCTFTVESDRVMHGPKMPKAKRRGKGMLTSHDTVPEPPVSGAED